MPNDATLSIIVRLQDEASAKLAAMAETVSAAGTKIGTVTQSLGDKISSMGESVKSFGKGITSTGTSLLGISAPLLAAGYAIESTYSQVNQSVQRAGAFVGASTEQIKGFQQAVIDAQKGTGFAMVDVANALGAFVGGEITAQEATQQLGDVIDLALVTKMQDLQQVANLAATAMSVYAKEGIKVTDVSDEMAVVAANVTTQTDRFAAAFSVTAGAARTAGYTFKDNIVLLSQLVAAGNDVNLVGAAVTSAFNHVEQGGKQMSEALAKVGMSTKEMQDAMRAGPTVWLEKLKEGFDKASESGQGYAFLIKTVGIQAADQFAIAMTRDSSSMEQVAGWFTDVTDKSKPLIETMRATVPVSQLMRASFEQLAMQGKPLDDLLHSLADKFQGLVNWFNQLSPSTQKWIFIILVLAATLAPVLIILGSLITALGTIAGAIGGVVTGIGFLVTAVSGAELTMSTFAVAIAPWLIALAALAAAVYLVSNAYGAMQEAAGGALAASSKLTADAKKLDPLITNATGDRKAKLQALQDSANKTADYTGQVGARYTGLSGASHALTDFLHITNAPQFADGGIVPGSPGQAVPIIAHAGEQIIPTKDVGKTAGGMTFNFHFHDVVAGEDGIRNIITRTMQQLNRDATLKRYAGA